MANTIKSRVQLKNDTEENWNKAIRFIPLRGEPVIYLADEAHPFFRVKIGDGMTNVINLPFIDAATINGVDINNIEVKLKHKLTFGAREEFIFDGSEDVTVPVYNGTII